MKIKKRGEKKSLTKRDLKWYTLNEVFGKASKTKEFQKGYREESMRIKLAQKIRETRVKQNLTQQAIAKKAAMPQSVIARLESGEHGMSVDTLSRVAHALGKEIELA